MDAVCFQVKTSISFLGQAGVKGCCEVSHLLCHPLGVYLIDDRKLPPLAGAFFQGTTPSSEPEDCVSSATSGASAASLPKVVVSVFVRYSCA